MAVNLPDTRMPTQLSATTQRASLPRVLYCLALNPDNKFGSLEEQIVFQAKRFQEEGSLFLPLFIADPRCDVSQFRQRGIDAKCLDLRHLCPRTLLQLRQIIRRERIDIVHWNFMPALRNQYVWALTLLTPRVRHWYTDHNSRPAGPPLRVPTGWRRLLKQALLKRYGRVWCVSQFVQDSLAAQKVWPNLVCTPHFVNTERFRPDGEARRQMRSAMHAENRFVLLTVSHLIAEKGVDVALRALAQLPANVVLWIVGEGPQRQLLETLIAELNLQERAKLLGIQAHVEPYMQAADCYLCPSLWAEAAGLVNLEAQACGTPVIASRIGGIPEYVADGETGLLFASGDAQQLAACIRRLLDEPELCQRLGIQGRIRAQADFSPAARLPEWLEVYRHWRDGS